MPPIVGSSIAAMANPTGTVLGEAAQLAADLGAEANQSMALVNVPKDDNKNSDVKPKSGLNFVAYNETFDIVPDNTGVLLVEDKINTIQTLATDRIVIKEAGFLEIFVNNEAQTPVYFDNIMAVQTVGRVLEVNAYYPYGMLLTALSTVAPGDEYNGYKYNGKELQDKMNLGWLDYGARMYDPAVGRWWVPDPLAEKHYNISSYVYCSNNPINFIDPFGLDTMSIHNMDDWHSFDPDNDVAKIDEVTITPSNDNNSNNNDNKSSDREQYNWWNISRESLGGGLVYWGNNNIPISGKTGGATPGTSRASSYYSKKYPKDLTKTKNKTAWKAVKKVVPKRVLGQPLRSPVVGRMVGRFVPILGEALLIWDAVDLSQMALEDQMLQIEENITNGRNPMEGTYVPGLGDFYTPFYGF